MGVQSKATLEARLKVRASTLDDLLNEVFRRLVASGQETFPSKGKAYEITGAVLELTNPRARLSRTEARAVFFSWIGEFLWYLAGSDEFAFVKYYIKGYKPDYEGAKTVWAAYGPRMRGKNKDQVKWVIDLIRKKPNTRRAVIPIYQPKDTAANHPEVPCTCTLQFLMRNQRIDLITHMRSNDAFVGLPGDIFAFTMLQEIVARALNVEPGIYKHLVGSLHLYDADRKEAQRFVAEGYQRKIMMPIMPSGDPFPNIERLLQFERSTRLGRHPNIPKDLPTYWRDLATLLAIFRADKDKKTAAVIKKIRKQVQSDAFNTYIDIRERNAQKREAPPSIPYPELPFE